VIGRIEEQKSRRAEGPRLRSTRDRLLSGGGLEPVATRVRVPQDLVAVGERREHHQIGVRQRQRTMFSQLPVDRVRVGAVAGIKQFEQ
jgi:hypothetical protein